MKLKSKFNIILLLIWFPVLSIHAQIQRCANPNPPYTVAENTAFKKAAGTMIYVPVIFHVIYDNSGNGNVSETKLQKQIDTLNATYSRAGSQYRFYLSAITRTNNTNWWNINFKLRPDPPYYEIPSQTEIDMTNALAIDPTHAFNIYVSRLLYDLCGWTIYFPWEVSEASKQNGIIIDYRTLPDGEMDYFNYGYTAVHEGGHYLGLYHTFQNGCTIPGDEVDDTPYQNTTFVDVCDDSLDTCPSPGKDPVHNYMNYTDDLCYNNFTAGQIGRIASITGQYKPNLGGTTLVFTSTYIVGNSTSLKIFPGMTLQFTSGSSLTVNGTLTASGTSSSPITFNFSSSNSTTENGIRFNNGSSGTINYCQIRNAYRGIYQNGVSINVTNSAISGCFNGIYLSNSSPTIQYCNIHDNVYAGIYAINYASPYLYNNYISNNYYGVYCTTNSNPKFGSGSTQGKNYLNNYCGVYCWNNSLPVLGKSSPLDGGYNNFVNASQNIYNASSGTVYANHIWWGTTVPANFKISGSGTTSYTDYLSSSVTISPAPPLSKSVGESYASEKDEIPMLSELDKAYELVASNNLNEARAVCMNLINNYPDYSVSYNALNLLKETYTDKETTSKSNIFKVLFSEKGNKDLYAMAGLILSDIDKENKLKHINKVIEKYKGEKVIELALFDKFVYYYFDMEDEKSARTISDELDAQFPKSIGAIEAHKILGDEEYLKLNLELQPKAETAKQVTEENKFDLNDNYPNPFNPTTTISYSLPEAGNVQIKIFDVLGREVAKLIDEIKGAGKHSVEWNGSNNASGIYFYTITFNNQTLYKKMLMIK